MGFESDARAAVEALAAYLRASGDRAAPVIRQPPLGELVEQLELRRWMARGGLEGEALGYFLTRYLEATWPAAVTTSPPPSSAAAAGCGSSS